MSVMGNGRFRHLTYRLPTAQARRFSTALTRLCGCRLALNLLRRSYMVVRPRGPNTNPVTYRDLDTPSMGLLPWIVAYIRLTDAQMAGNHDLVYDTYRRMWADQSSQETRDFVDTFLPDMVRTFRRVDEILTDGRWRPHHNHIFDFGASTRGTSTAAA